ncbi:MAG TPA: hypothetical protein VGX23_15070 [Actinocrinis sp.]|nr:hypothetical protein [Actinocrinis sp.]
MRQYGQPVEDDRGDEAGDVQAGRECLQRGARHFRSPAVGRVLAGGDGDGQRVGRSVHSAAVDHDGNHAEQREIERAAAVVTGFQQPSPLDTTSDDNIDIDP